MEKEPELIRGRRIWLAFGAGLLVPATAIWWTIVSGSESPGWLPGGAWGDLAVALGFPVLAYLIGRKVGSRPLVIFSLALIVLAALLTLLPSD
jgi:hypothetical protein